MPRVRAEVEIDHELLRWVDEQAFRGAWLRDEAR